MSKTKQSIQDDPLNVEPVYDLGYEVGHSTGYIEGYKDGQDDMSIISEVNIHNDALNMVLLEVQKYDFDCKDDLIASLQLLYKA